MTYDPKMWVDGECLLAADLNAMEAGTDRAQGDIMKPYGPTAGLPVSDPLLEGRLYFESDLLRRVWRDNGAGWDNVTPFAGNGLLNNLTAYWKEDEPGGANDALDAHINGLTMTQTHSPGSAAGIINTARVFAAGDYFSRLDDAWLSTGDVDFTISGWVYPTNLAAGGGQVIFSKLNIAGNQREYVLYYNNVDHVPNDRFSFAVSSNGVALQIIDANTFGGVLNNAWYHLVGWHDAATDQIGISVNNVADTIPYALGVFDSTASAAMGVFFNGAAIWYQLIGRGDETGFWKSAPGGGGALTPADRLTLWNGGAALPYGSFTA